MYQYTVCDEMHCFNYRNLSWITYLSWSLDERIYETISKSK